MQTDAQGFHKIGVTASKTIPLLAQTIAKTSRWQVIDGVERATLVILLLILFT